MSPPSPAVVSLVASLSQRLDGFVLDCDDAVERLGELFDTYEVLADAPTETSADVSQLVSDAEQLCTFDRMVTVRESVAEFRGAP